MISQVKITQVVSLINCGTVAGSYSWRRERDLLHAAVQRVEWPVGTGKFTIHPESGKKRDEGNGVTPIKNGLLVELKAAGWQLESVAKNALGAGLGAFDAAKDTPDGPIVLEWETGNISSSHRSLNKMAMLLMSGGIAVGTLVVPSRALCKYLTDRIGNIAELEPYFTLWGSVAVPCKSCGTRPVESGVLEIVVIEHDATSTKVPRIPKGTSGRAKG